MSPHCFPALLLAFYFAGRKQIRNYKLLVKLQKKKKKEKKKEKEKIKCIKTTVN